MTAEDDETREDRNEDAQDDAADQDGAREDADDRDDSDDSDDEDASGDGSVKDRGRDDDDTPGVTDARPGREDIGEGSMPSDYHEAVAQRPVEVKLPETPDLSEDAEGGTTDGEPDGRG